MATLVSKLSNQFEEVYYGGNWTAVNLQDQLGDVNLAEAIEQVEDCNTIYVLSYHMHWYILTQTEVLQGGKLIGTDKDSFLAPELTSQQDWESFRFEIFMAADKYIKLLDGLTDDQLDEDFVESKYGSYYRNIQGLIEHCHYHLGQISLLKKLVKKGS